MKVIKTWQVVQVALAVVVGGVLCMVLLYGALEIDRLNGINEELEKKGYTGGVCYDFTEPNILTHHHGRGEKTVYRKVE